MNKLASMIKKNDVSVMDPSKYALNFKGYTPEVQSDNYDDEKGDKCSLIDLMSPQVSIIDDKTTEKSRFGSKTML